jgi:hypothetical protein
MRKTALIVLSLLGITQLTSGMYRHKIDAFSFDTAYEDYPLAYNTFGAATGLKTKMKLVPLATPTSGAIFLNQVITHSYCNYYFDKASDNSSF